MAGVARPRPWREAALSLAVSPLFALPPLLLPRRKSVVCASNPTSKICLKDSAKN